MVGLPSKLALKTVLRHGATYWNGNQVGANLPPEYCLVNTPGGRKAKKFARRGKRGLAAGRCGALSPCCVVAPICRGMVRRSAGISSLEQWLIDFLE
ncbi:MAG: hypothetical protein L0H83_14900 [Salinisphaera sp.]|nr:hypothetical protein [Salinisphaera sp.]